MYGLGAVVILLLIFTFSRGKNDQSDPQDEAIDTIDESSASIELPSDEYYYIRPDLQRRVIALKSLDESEYPVPYDFTEYGKEHYARQEFYALVILDIDTDVRLNTETITEVAELQLIGFDRTKPLESLYNQMNIRYEDGHVVYHHDNIYYVTSLDEPQLYKNYVFFGSEMPSKPTQDTDSIMVLETSYRTLTFRIRDKSFSEFLRTEEFLKKEEPYDFASKAILHEPSLSSVQGPDFSKITSEPRLNQFTLGSSSSVIFDRLGTPDDKGWIVGDYLLYDDLMIYSPVDEKKDEITFYPISAVMYYGEYPIAGIKKGMSLTDVQQILKPESLIFSEGSEIAYPLVIPFKRDGFDILMTFDRDLKVQGFRIRTEEIESVDAEEASDRFDRMISEIENEFSEVDFNHEGLFGYEDFRGGLISSYFNASTTINDRGEPIDLDFYSYDLTSRQPKKISDQPMRLFFELLDDVNPSLITVGKDDGILYKIDINSSKQIPLYGTNFKDYLIRGGTMMKAALVSDASFLEHYGFSPGEEYSPFEVTVPMDWTVELGSYPEGLYWQLANVYSKDVGLDLNRIKGKTVMAHVYRLIEEVPDRDPLSRFTRPADVVILRAENQIVGAWLMYNIGTVGPSLEGKSMEAITGMNFDNWLINEGIFKNPTEFSALETQSPFEVLEVYIDSVDRGNLRKANACLTPGSLAQSLTMNLFPSSGKLYHSDFNEDNSATDNIVSASDLEIVRIFDPNTLEPIDRTKIRVAMLDGDRIEIEVRLNLEWKQEAFNNPGEKSTRFAILKKYPFGWKLDGFGTGP
jgi:hypothetical protein